MAAQSNRFPAFITDEYRPGNGFAEFERESQAASERSRRHFEASFADIKRIAMDALSTPRNTGGSLDLGVDQYRSAAAAADAHAIALRELAVAAERAAVANGDTSEATRLYVQAARAAAIEAEGAAKGAHQEAVAMERLQTELNATASRTQQVITGNRGLRQSQDMVAQGARATRFAYVQTGQQLQDIVIQAQAGTDAFTILVQQGSQVAFALSNIGGRLGALASFLAGPWGTAVFIGVAALGALATGLGGAEEEAKKLELASDSLGEAQGVLGQIFDLTTGKLEKQSEALRLNARLMAINLRAEAETQLRSARQTFDDVGDRGFMARLGVIGEGVMDGKSPAAIRRAQFDADRRGREQRALLEDLEKRRITDEEALRRSEGMDFSGLAVSREEFQQALIDREAAIAKRKIAQQVDQSLDRGVLDPALRQVRKTPDRSREQENLEEFARDAAARMESITGRFADQPKAVEQARKALSDLDDLLDDIQRKNQRSLKIGGGGLPGFDNLVASAEEARVVVREGLIRELAEGFERAPTMIDKAADAITALDAAARLPGFEGLTNQFAAAKDKIREGVLRPFDDLLKQFERQATVQNYLIQGREAEAEVQREINQLIASYGVEAEKALQNRLEEFGLQGNIRDVIREQIELSRKQAREYQVMREQLQPYLDTLNEVRQNITRTIEGLTAGNVLGSVKSFASGIGSSFNRLFAETLSERLFGDAFRELEKQLRGETPAEKAEKRLAGAMDGGSAAVDGFTSTMEVAAERVAAAADALASVPAKVAEMAAPAAAASATSTAVLAIGKPLARMFVGGDSHAEHRARGSHGVDLRAAVGTALASPIEGILSTSRSSRGGLQAFVTSLDGRMKFGFAHLSGVMAELVGQNVKLGQIIGRTGNSGGVDPHLHASLRIGGKAVDPMKYFGKTVEGVGAASASTTDRMTELATVVGNLTKEAQDLGAGLGSVTDVVASVANDNEVIVNGPRRQALSPRILAEMLGNKIGSVFGSPKFGTQIASSLAQAAPYIGLAMQATSSISSLLGIKNRAGGLFGVGGNLLINEVIPSKRASSTIGFSGGQLITTTSGNSKKFKAGSLEGADSAIANIERIAEALGGTITGTGSVSIGIRDGKYRVDTSGRGITKTKKGALDFGEDGAAAVKAATLDLIRDGMIAGLRAGSQQLLRNAKDLEVGLGKALQFEGVFKELKRRTNPVGAALDELNAHYESLKRIFEQAGASAAEYADLEKLYQLERTEAMEQASAQMTSTLKGLIEDLTINNDALSLRDRLAAARAKYDPLAAEFASGNYAHADAFAEAGRAVESIIREIEGSQEGYFDFLATFTELAKKGLAYQEGLIAGAGSGAPGPFTAPAADAAPVVGAIDKLGTYLAGELGGHLKAVNDNLGTLIRKLPGGGGGEGGFPKFMDRANF